MEIIQLLVIFLGGLAGGFYGSTVGGGALVSLPLLILMGLPTPVALGTQRLGAVILELTSSLRFYRAGKLNLRLGLILGLIGMIGTIIGVNVLISLDPKVLNLIIAVLLVLVAIVLLNKERLGIKERALTRRHTVWLGIATAFMGFYAGFFGAGAGVFWTLLLVLFGFSFIDSAGIARVIGTCTSLVAAVIFAAHGLINYRLGLALGAGFAIGSWVGIGVALKRGDAYIKAILVLVVAFSVLKLILNSLGIHAI